MINHVHVVQTATHEMFERRLATEIDAIQRNGMRVEVQMMCPPPSDSRYAALVLAHQDS
jgi:hypothetical protein